jgi:5-methylcytosine-specific restriction endonuclease McrA
MNHVFVVDTNRKPMSMCHPARARALLKADKAAVLRAAPFTIILKEEKPDAIVKPMVAKIDPGSKTTGIALVDSANRMLFAAELEHRGKAIKASLDSRRVLRRGRRNRKTRYRQARFNNRRRADGWLPPSLQHRVKTTMTWIERFRRWCGLDKLAVERVKFDMQRMHDPEISGVEYQQGTLMGYSVREYLLEKWHRTCAYCGAEDVPLQVEHIHPKSKGGTNRISNLTLACKSCNKKKDVLSIEVFLTKKPDVLKRILAQAKKPLSDAAAVNATRNALFNTMLKTGLPVETGTGSQTKFNRTQQKYPKEHWIDAACVGDSGLTVTLDATTKPLLIKATGQGNRQMCGTDKFGFPIRHRSHQKKHFGFETGDLVRAIVPSGKKAGVYRGRVICRARGSFDISTNQGRVAGISYRHFTSIQRKDGYAYF